MDKRADDILHYWFGRIEDTVVPSPRRTHIWFSGAPEIDSEIRQKYETDYHKALAGDFDIWEQEPRGRLALIVLFDQFSRSLFRDTAEAFSQDNKALDLCLRGIEAQQDHTLSLIERAFFYMPLMHSEALDMQNTSVQAFKMLSDLSFPEARGVFNSFLDYAIRHFEVIQQFGRFPHRNVPLGRENTPDEQKFIDEHKGLAPW